MSSAELIAEARKFFGEHHWNSNLPGKQLAGALESAEAERDAALEVIAKVHSLNSGDYVDSGDDEERFIATRAALAQAWDEGVQAYVTAQWDGDGLARNPYRAGASK